MSHSYIDGVPVKISERYKPPPKISLPQKIVQCLAECHNAIDGGRPSPADVYDFQAEHNHLRQAVAWKNSRRQERFERRQRMHQRQVDRQREHDERQKQKLTAVSYPSADELSSGDDDEEDTNNANAGDDLAEDNHSTTAATSSLATSSSGQTTAETTPQSHQEPPSSNHQPHQQQRFDTILMPTIMPLVSGHPARNPADSNWSFAAKLAADREAQSASGASAPPTGTASTWSKINWSDFENDTSSPFDNIELKSINDLDILAQVLNLNVDATTTTTTTSSVEADAKQPAAPPPPPTTCDNVHSMASSVGRAEAITVSRTGTHTSTTTAATAMPTPPQRITDNNTINSNCMPAASPQNHYIAPVSYYGQYQAAPYATAQYTHMAYGQQCSPTIGDMATTSSSSGTYTLPTQAVYHFNYHNAGNTPAMSTAYTDTRYASSYGGSQAPAATSTTTAMRGFDGGVVGAFKSSSVPDILRHTAVAIGPPMGSKTDATAGAMGAAPANGTTVGSVRYF